MRLKKTLLFLFFVCNTFVLSAQRTGNWGICIDQFQLHNAEAVRVQIKKMGFEKTAIYKRGKWFSMVVEGFTSQEIAQKELLKVQTLHPKAYILDLLLDCPNFQKKGRYNDCGFEKVVYTDLATALVSPYKVYSLDLSRQQLKSLPTLFSKLVNLQSLNLSYNHFEEFPDVVCQLKSLKRLIVRDLEKGGKHRFKTIPPLFSSLKQLEVLDLSHNNELQDLSPVFQLLSLEDLRIRSIGWKDRRQQLPAFHNLIKGISKLNRLKKLDISGHEWRCTQFPNEILDLPQLQELDLSENWLQVLPDVLSKKLKLRKLNLSKVKQANRRVAWNLNVLFQSNLLQELDLSHNALKNDFNIAYANLPQLKVLNLSHCDLKQLPAGLCMLTALQTLDLSHNQLTTLPNCERFLALENLNLDANAWVQMPAALFKMRQLKTLSMLPKAGANPAKIKAIPAGIGKLVQLESLILTGQNIQVLHTEVSKLEKLKNLQLADNQCNRVDFLRLLGDLKNLETLNLSGNGVSVLPPNWSKLQRLQDLNLDNMPNGEFVGHGFDMFPEVLTELPRLRQLNLNGGHIDSIPASLGKLKNLLVLELHQQAIQFLPPELSQLQQLHTLDISTKAPPHQDPDQSEAFWRLPQSICQLRKLKKLHIGRQNLEPEQLEEIKNCLKSCQIK